MDLFEIPQIEYFKIKEYRRQQYAKLPWYQVFDYHFAYTNVESMTKLVLTCLDLSQAETEETEAAENL